MKVHIFFDFVAGPCGGSNQFLKMLKKVIILQGFYEENPENADIILKEQGKYPPKQSFMATKANFYLVIIHLYVLRKVGNLKHRIMLWMK